MKTSQLKNKFSIGFTCHFMPLSDFKKLIDDYSYYTNDVYFSPPYGKKFHTRSFINKTLKPNLEVEKQIFSFLKKLADKDIKLTLALNTHEPATEEVLGAAERVVSQLPIDSITTLSKHLPALVEKFPDITYKCSYNEGVKTAEEAQKIAELEDFSYITIGSSGLRDKELWQTLEGNGVKVIHMLNNGCSMRCRHFCTPPVFPRCEDQFFETLAKPEVTMEKMYAEQSIMPRELHEFLIPEENISHFKLSTRPWHYQNFNLCFQSYIENLNKELIDDSAANWRLWARLNHFSDLDKFDYDKICSLKNKLWAGDIQNSYEKFGPYKPSTKNKS